MKQMLLSVPTLPVKKEIGKARRFCRFTKNFSADMLRAESILNGSTQTRTISGVISARECAPHICMVSASSPASLSM